ncbi:MAG: relaxase/mobilization nuclease domain-containing protein, partial [Deltaproteobacteria bacterium]|nr:relaxase/mobilization nuclease domain-containing protein [Deltaproteobacteria bacterium]
SMYPRIAKKGTSFKGAALYYLHDKDAQTNDRVEFTQTQNLHTDDPEMAWKMMAYTAMNQNEIKKAAGVKNTGNKAKTSVYSYSLSWKPSDTFKDKPQPNPSIEEMIKAGLDTLKLMGLHEHESMIVGHNDTDHSHIHVIVNRVHPETGIVDTHSNDKLKLSKWAEKHERERGQILCQTRAENNERRRNGEYVKFKEDMAKAEYYRWQREKTRHACEQREKDAKTLDGLQKQKRDELLNNKETLIKEKISQIRELNRSSWASIYRQQKEESLTTQEAQRSAMSRFFDYLKNRNQEREHGALDAKRGLCSG